MSLYERISERVKKELLEMQDEAAGQDEPEDAAYGIQEAEQRVQEILTQEMLPEDC